MSIDFNKLMEAAGAGFTPVPVGDYDVQVASAVPKLTSNGKLQIAVQFKIISGPHAGRNVPNNFVLSPENTNALVFFFNHMAILGLTKEFFQTNPSPESIAANLVGKSCRITVNHRNWQGTVRMDVKQILPLGAGGVPSMSVGPVSAQAIPPAPQPQAPAPQPIAQPAIQQVAPAVGVAPAPPAAPAVPVAAQPVEQPAPAPQPPVVEQLPETQQVTQVAPNNVVQFPQADQTSEQPPVPGPPPVPF